MWCERRGSGASQRGSRSRSWPGVRRYGRQRGPYRVRYGREWGTGSGARGPKWRCTEGAKDGESLGAPAAGAIDAGLAREGELAAADQSS